MAQVERKREQREQEVSGRLRGTVTRSWKRLPRTAAG
jgi:hypothetical protein